jgi:hypothetical protein
VSVPLIRNAALALAGTAFAVSVLLGPVTAAAAAPAPSPDGVVLAKSPTPQPAKPGPQPGPNILNPTTVNVIPNGDVSVDIYSKSLESDGSTKYWLQYTNFGPDRMTFDVRFDRVLRNSMHLSPDIAETWTYPGMTVGAGESINKVASCTPQEGYYCLTLTATIVNIRGIDPNTSNNTDMK